jgi:polyhydroxyalkanoate synthesis regulator phasin
MLPLEAERATEVESPVESLAVESTQDDDQSNEESMASSAERMTILRMVEQGKISAEEGTRLLTALGSRQEAESKPRANVFDTSRTLQVRVSDLATNRQKVNVNLPVGLLQLAWRWLPASAQTQLEQVQAAIDAGISGRLVEVVDQESGVRVEITLM